MNRERCNGDRDARRSLDRWVETLPAFSSLSGRLKALAALRNLMAHEYLDLRFGRVMGFVSGGFAAVAELSAATRGWLISQAAAGSPQTG